MKTKHTPGPWKAEVHNESTEVWNQNTKVAVINEAHEFSDTEMDLANAHLIAAAPCMLRALQAAQEALCEVGGREATEALELIDEAIAKAEGES